MLDKIIAIIIAIIGAITIVASAVTPTVQEESITHHTRVVDALQHILHIQDIQPTTTIKDADDN